MDSIELVKRMKASEIQKQKLAKLSSAELGELLVREVWADVELFTFPSDLLEVVIEQLKGEHVKAGNHV